VTKPYLLFFPSLHNTGSQNSSSPPSVARQYLATLPIYTKRARLISKIPFFWPLVFEQAPPDIDQYIQPSDSALLAAALSSLTVTRFEVPRELPPLSAAAAPEPESNPLFGEPRSLCLRFEFKENEWFEDSVLEKRFWYRRARDGWCGRVSEPVKIKWKNGKDLTGGLGAAAWELWEAQKKRGLLDGKAKGDGSAEGKGKAKEEQTLPECEKLKKLVEESIEGSQSFFAWFGYRGRYVSKEESDVATNEVGQNWGRKGKLQKDEELEGEEKLGDSDEVEVPEDATEIFPRGDELAVGIAEDIWPSAILLFSKLRRTFGPHVGGVVGADRVKQLKHKKRMSCLHRILKPTSTSRVMRRCWTLGAW